MSARSTPRTPSRAWATPRSSTSASRTSTTRGPSPAPCSSRVVISRPRSRTGCPTRTARSSSTAPAGSGPCSRADTLQQLGYTDVVSMTGGFGRWKNEGRTWMTPAVLNPEQRNRYHRHLLLPEVGEAGQQRLLESKVLLLGAGGLGSPAALYLAAAGVGTLGIVDMDVVDASNLQRQILHNVDRIGERKVDSAKKTLTRPEPRRRRRHLRRAARRGQRRWTSSTGYDVIVDGTDNFPTRYLVNDASLLDADAGRARLDLPLRGSGHGLQAATRARATAACFPEPPPPELAPSCAEAGVLGVLPGIIGSIQALEAIKLAARPRRPAHRPAARLRRARGELPHLQGPVATRAVRRVARTRRRSSSPNTTTSACRTPRSPTARPSVTEFHHRRN